MKRILIACAAFLLVLTSTAQPLKRAQKQMDLYNYSRAIEILKKSVRNEKLHDKAIPMLAECYRMQHDIPNSLEWFEKASKLKHAKPEWIFRYAQALQAYGNYEKAMEAYQKYQQANPGDSKAAAMIKQCELLTGTWKNAAPRYEVRALPSINSPASDFGPAFYANGFTFASDRGKNYISEDTYGWTGRKYLKILFAKPKELGDFFGEYREPYLMDGKFNQSFHDGPVSFAGDSVAMFSRTNRERKAKKTGNIRTDFLKIYSTARLNGDWQKMEPFFLNSYDYSVGHPALSADGQTVYFASDMPGGQGGVDIWKCTREGESWSSPKNLGPTVNTAGNEMFPSVKNDGTLFFASDGLPGYGGLDIFSTRQEKGNYVTPCNLMAPINSSYDDFGMAWIPGTTYGMFSSDRPGGKGLDDIYAFKRLADTTPELIKHQPALVYGIVKDKVTSKPLAGVTVFILNETTDSVGIVQTDVDGYFHYRLEYPASLIVKATTLNYIPDCLTWSKELIIVGEDNRAPRELLLSKLEVNKTFALKNIYYDFDKYDIRPDAEPALDNLVRIMKDNPITIELSSHTDCRGSFAYNDKLSLRRAEAAVNYLLSNGIELSRISSKGYGEHQLVNRCSDGVPCSAAEHQENRRTEFKVISFMNPNAVIPGQLDPGKFIPGKSYLRDAFPSGFFMQCQ